MFPKVMVPIGTPKSSILIGFSIINHPFGVPLIFGNTYINLLQNDSVGSAVDVMLKP